MNEEIQTCRYTPLASNVVSCAAKPMGVFLRRQLLMFYFNIL